MMVPFYVAGKEAPRVVIIGGGYSALAALVTLREHCPDAEIKIVDPRPHHLKITHLHESFRRPLTELSVPYPHLEERFRVRHYQTLIDFDEQTLCEWNRDRGLPIGDERVEFDYLLIAVGALPQALVKNEACLDLEDFMQTAGPELLAPLLAHAGVDSPWITLIGAGATGIQFLFELTHYLRTHDHPCRVRLVDAEAAPLAQFPPKLGRYVESRLSEQGIEFWPRQFFRGQDQGQIELEDLDSGTRRSLPSSATLLFIGKSASRRLATNWFGQVVAEGRALERVFAAGDCARFPAPGSNAQSAQSAVRKGKLVARNILRHSGRVKLLEPYLHRDLGYVVSLGPTDVIGWLGIEQNVVGGLPALAIKEIVEAQYDLLLAGIDTYLL